MKDYRVTVKVRNNRILKAIEAVGGVPGQKWCDEVGLCYTTLNKLINMTTSPLAANGGLRDQAQKLCEVVNAIPDDLWSSEQLHPLEKNFSSFEMDHQQVVELMYSEQDYSLLDTSAMEARELSGLLKAARATLGINEQYVLYKRFVENATYDACGKDLGVTGPRARQIEASALRKLRHPKIACKLVDAVDLDIVSKEKRQEIKAAADYYLANERKVK